MKVKSRTALVGRGKNLKALDKLVMESRDLGQYVEGESIGDGKCTVLRWH